MQYFKPSLTQPLVGQLLLAHGAGAGSHSEFMQATASLLAKQGIATWLFDFPYMQRMVDEGQRRPPDRMPKLLVAFKDAIANVGRSRDFDPSIGLYIGGKSMGGRVATYILTTEVLDEVKRAEPKLLINGGVVLGYPFRPPGKQSLRVEHFADIAKPVFIAQGERDAFGGRDLLSELSLPSLISSTVLPDGDHSFKPRKASGLTVEANIEQMVNEVKEWMCRLDN